MCAGTPCRATQCQLHVLQQKFVFLVVVSGHNPLRMLHINFLSKSVALQGRVAAILANVTLHCATTGSYLYIEVVCCGEY